MHVATVAMPTFVSGSLVSMIPGQAKRKKNAIIGSLGVFGGVPRLSPWKMSTPSGNTYDEKPPKILVHAYTYVQIRGVRC